MRNINLACLFNKYPGVHCTNIFCTFSSKPYDAQFINGTKQKLTSLLEQTILVALTSHRIQAQTRCQNDSDGLIQVIPEPLSILNFVLDWLYFLLWTADMLKPSVKNNYIIIHLDSEHKLNDQCSLDSENDTLCTCNVVFFLFWKPLWFKRRSALKIFCFLF